MYKVNTSLQKVSLSQKYELVSSAGKTTNVINHISNLQEKYKISRNVENIHKI